MMKELFADSFVILSLAVLHDDFRFGRVRCQRFRDRLDRTSDYLDEELAEWLDYAQSIKDELGIELKTLSEYK